MSKNIPSLTTHPKARGAGVGALGTVFFQISLKIEHFVNNFERKKELVVQGGQLSALKHKNLGDASPCLKRQHRWCFAHALNLSSSVRLMDSGSQFSWQTLDLLCSVFPLFFVLLSTGFGRSLNQVHTPSIRLLCICH
jgi:hypothetical protein